MQTLLDSEREFSGLTWAEKLEVLRAVNKPRPRPKPRPQKLRFISENDDVDSNDVCTNNVHLKESRSRTDDRKDVNGESGSLTGSEYGIDAAAFKTKDKVIKRRHSDSRSMFLWSHCSKQLYEQRRIRHLVEQARLKGGNYCFASEPFNEHRLISDSSENQNGLRNGPCSQSKHSEQCVNADDASESHTRGTNQPLCSGDIDGCGPFIATDNGAKMGLRRTPAKIELRRSQTFSVFR